MRGSVIYKYKSPPSSRIEARFAAIYPYQAEFENRKFETKKQRREMEQTEEELERKPAEWRRRIAIKEDARSMLT
jgi:hypothetical protein